MASSRAEVIIHPVRIRILQHLAGGIEGRKMTAQQIGSELPDVPIASLYRHLSKLVEADIIQVVSERQVRGAVERLYALPRRGALLNETDVRQLSRQDHMRYFTIFVAGLLGDFARYLDRDKIDLIADGAGYRQLGIYLSDEEMAEVARAVNAILGPLMANGPGQGRRRWMLTTVLMPADDREESSEPERKE